MGKSIDLYKNLATLVFEAGVNQYPEYDFAIINALEMKEVAKNFQLEQFHANRNFFLAILQNKDVGYLYDGPILKEGKKVSSGDIDTKDVVKRFIEDFRNNKLHAYLMTETSETTPVIRDSILRVYGSNFISLVKDRKYAQPGTMKGLILMFTKQNCPQCDWTEAYFDRLSAEFGEEDFQFAIMDIDQNSPTYDIK